MNKEHSLIIVPGLGGEDSNTNAFLLGQGLVNYVRNFFVYNYFNEEGWNFSKSKEIKTWCI